MTREEKLRQASEKWSNGCYNVSDELFARIAFIRGAEWADNNPAQDVVHLKDVWHDAEEFPAEVGTILYRTHLGQFCTVRHGASGEGIWKVFVKDYGVAEWAYISDLLPKTKELLNQKQ